MQPALVSVSEALRDVFFVPVVGEAIELVLICGCIKQERIVNAPHAPCYVAVPV